MKHQKSRGFSLPEMLVVMAIIGILSLVTVPAFINYQRTLRLRGALRSLTGDVRMARQMAISRNVRVRLIVDNNTTYRTIVSSDNGATWRQLPLRIQDEAGTGLNRNSRALPPTVTIATTFVDETSPDDGDTLAEAEFRPDGTVWDDNVQTGGTFTLRTTSNATRNKADVTISTTGQISSVESKV